MEKNMEKVLQKAEVLIEALPYIQRFNRKIIVVKYGGSAMSNQELQRNVIKDVTLLKLVGFKPIIVHGGGKEISRWVSKVGKEPKFVNGLRVTDQETMEIAEMVLNKVNKDLVTMVQELGVKAVGVSGKDGGLLQVEKKCPDGQDIGFVGEITSVNPKVLYDLLEGCEGGKTGVPDRCGGAVSEFSGEGRLPLQDLCVPGGRTDRRGKCGRGHAAQIGKLYQRRAQWGKPGSHSGWQDSPLPAVGNIHQTGHWNGHFRRQRDGITGNI